MQDKPAYLMILLEFQSSPDPWMVIRFLVYVGLLYQQLIKENQLRSGKLPPVFPVVLYNGSKTWQSPITLKKLTHIIPVSVAIFLTIGLTTPYRQFDT